MIKLTIIMFTILTILVINCETNNNSIRFKLIFDTKDLNFSNKLTKQANDRPKFVCKQLTFKDLVMKCLYYNSKAHKILSKTNTSNTCKRITEEDIITKCFLFNLQIDKLKGIYNTTKTSETIKANKSCFCNTKKSLDDLLSEISSLNISEFKLLVHNISLNNKALFVKNVFSYYVSVSYYQSSIFLTRVYGFVSTKYKETVTLFLASANYITIFLAEHGPIFFNNTKQLVCFIFNFLSYHIINLIKIGFIIFFKNFKRLITFLNDCFEQA